jgi:hypothetical protein
MLFEMIFMEAAARLFPTINEIFSSEESLFQKIERFCEEYINVVIENPYLPLFVINEINQDPNYFLAKVWTGKSKPNPRKFLEQLEKEIKNGTIRAVNPLHLLMNLLSMTVFPFVAKPMFQKNFGLNEQQFRLMMDQRKKEIPDFIIKSLRK